MITFEEFLDNMRSSLAHINNHKDQYTLTDDIAWCQPGFMLSKPMKDRLGDSYKGKDHVYSTIAGAYLLKNPMEDIKNMEGFKDLIHSITTGNIKGVAMNAEIAFTGRQKGKTYVDPRKVNLAYRMTDPVKDWRDVEQVCKFFSQFHYRFTDNPEIMS